MDNTNDMDMRPAGLTAGQAASLGEIAGLLRPLGFDPDGRGLGCPNLHVSADGAAGRISWWLDADEGVANGSMDANGHGPWWLRRTYSPRLMVI